MYTRVELFLFETQEETGTNGSAVCWILVIFRNSVQEKIEKAEKENVELTFL